MNRAIQVKPADSENRGGKFNISFLYLLVTYIIRLSYGFLIIVVIYTSDFSTLIILSSNLLRVRYESSTNFVELRSKHTCVFQIT